MLLLGHFDGSEGETVLQRTTEVSCATVEVAGVLIPCSISRSERKPSILLQSSVALYIKAPQCFTLVYIMV